MKVKLDGEYHDFDGSKKPMSEALAVERAWGKRYAEWESELEAGSAEAMCVLAWIIWRRAGRDIKLDDILSGEVDFDLAEMLNSITESQQQEAEAARPPTPAAGSAPDGTRTTRRATKRSLASTCIYGRGRFPC
jgi:hypothetical protein